MFPENFYPYGAMLTTALLAMGLSFLFAKWRPMRRIGWKTAFAIFFFGNATDYFSTWFFTTHLGIGDEANKLARELMQMGWLWYTMYKLVALNILSVLISAAGRRCRMILAFPIALGIILTLSAVHNVIAALQQAIVGHFF